MKANNNIFKSTKLQSLIKTAVLGLVCATLFFAVAYKSNMLLKGFKVNIEGIGDDKYLISQKEIKSIVEEQLGFELKKATIDDLNLRVIEDVLVKDSRVESAEVYVNKRNYINVDIIQRKPIYRVNAGTKYPYYVDLSGERISVKRSVKKIRVPVVTGNVDPYHSKFRTLKNHNLKDIHNFFTLTSGDKFMRSLVEQLHVEADGQFIIIPKIGDKKIILGGMDNLKEKIKNLKTYYKQVGMDDFKVLDLRFKDQVVGRT